MKKFIVVFSYEIDVNAEEATQKAIQTWDDIVPRTDEMNIEIEHVD